MCHFLFFYFLYSPPNQRAIKTTPYNKIPIIADTVIIEATVETELMANSGLFGGRGLDDVKKQTHSDRGNNHANDRGRILCASFSG
jgi:hypothetical protein